MYLFILICVGAPSSEFRRHHDMVLQAAGDLGAAAAGDDAAGGAQQGAVRQRLRNAVEYAVLVMSDPSIRQFVLLLAYTPEPIRLWHKEQVERNRSHGFGMLFS